MKRKIITWMSVAMLVLLLPLNLTATFDQPITLTPPPFELSDDLFITVIDVEYEVNAGNPRLVFFSETTTTPNAAFTFRSVMPFTTIINGMLYSGTAFLTSYDREIVSQTADGIWFRFTGHYRAYVFPMGHLAR